MKKLYTITSLLVSVAIVWAQAIPWNNQYQRQKTLTITQSNTQLDSLSIIPDGFIVTDSLGNHINSQNFNLNYINATFKIHDKYLNTKLNFNYYINPNSVVKKISSYDSLQIIDPVKWTKTLNDPDLRPENKSILGKLQTQGSIVRGIFLGNNQNASTLSSLDLKLEGQLSQDISIAARIYDHNVPVENNGYTQNINEFENFYIEILNSNSKIKAGYIDLEQKDNYLANFNRKVMGVELLTELKRENSNTRIFASGSIARGEFHRYQFNGLEGNQGPYKLIGKNGEIFIVLLPNAEKVYWDGILLEAGDEKDYTINRQTGELTFTNKHLVTAQSRITVEYQYTTRNYNRYLLYSGLEYNSERLSIAGNVFSESDAKNSSGTQNLTDSEKHILAQAGDNPENAYTTTEVYTPYEDGKILYKKTIVGSQTIYEYSQNPNETLYTLSFSYVGANKGNYKRSQIAVNGKIYEFIAPVGTLKQGDYEPVKRLIAPEKKQVYSVYGTYKLNKNNPNKYLKWSVALSNKDANSFSDSDDENNVGFASNLLFQSDYTFQKWIFKPTIQYQFLHKNYTILDRIQTIEFNREFNRSQEFSFVNQHNIQTSLHNTLGKHTIIHYQLNYINEDTLYVGTKNSLTVKFEKNKWKLHSQNAYLTTQSNIEKTNFLQTHQVVTRLLKPNKLFSTEFRLENNQRKNNNHTYNLLSFAMQEIAINYQKTDSQTLNYKTRLYQRKDDSLRNNMLTNISQSWGNQWNISWQKNENHHFLFDADFRHIQYNPNLNPNVHTEKFLIGKAQWNGIFIQKSLTLNAQYSLESGREAQREFQYVRVAEGQGIYKWTDYNNNGIEELDEFEVAEFQDLANYVRVFLNNVSYQKTNQTGLNLSIALLPEKWNSENLFWKKLMLRSSFSTLTSYWKNNELATFNPFESENIFNRNQSIITTLQYNKISQDKWDFLYKYAIYNNTKTVFLGKEANKRFYHDILFKYKLFTEFIAQFQYNFGKIENTSELFSTRNYNILHHLLSPSLVYDYGKEITAKTFYRYNTKVNTWGNEKLTMQELGAELRWDKGKNSFLGKFSFIKNETNSSSQSVVLNQMMEGLQQGNNMVWSVVWQRELTSFLMLNLNYQGRKNEEYKTIHTGNIQLKALF